MHTPAAKRSYHSNKPRAPTPALCGRRWSGARPCLDGSGDEYTSKLKNKHLKMNGEWQFITATVLTTHLKNKSESTGIRNDALTCPCAIICLDNVVDLTHHMCAALAHGEVPMSGGGGLAPRQTRLAFGWVWSS